jgi:hypothetical protein
MTFTVSDAERQTKGPRRQGLQRRGRLRIAIASAETFETLYLDHLANLPHVQKLTSQLAMKVVKRSGQLPIAGRRSSKAR